MPLLIFVILLASTSFAHAQDAALLDPYRHAAEERWSSAIDLLDQRNAQESHPTSSVLFVGSSSIRRWDTITEDVAPFHPIQRGYGGAKFRDLAVFAERIIQPHRYRAMVVFVANDITGKDKDLTVDQVEPLVRHVVRVSREHQPQAPVLLIEITPTSSRFKAWSKIREMNARIRDVALTTPHTYFIPTASHYLHPDTKTPRDELFVDDRLHLNRDGYRIWGKLIRSQLQDVLRREALAKSSGSSSQ